jgi:hypothetical protein
MTVMETKGLPEHLRVLRAKLREERVVFDLEQAADREVLERDVERIARDMDDPGRPPPMFWSGIPWPEPVEEPSCDYRLVVSIGGTKTDFALLRLDRGQVIGLDVVHGREVSDPAEIDRVKGDTQMPTPKYGPDCPTGQEMVLRMARNLTPHVRANRAAFERCESILLSWGFPHRVIRTGPRLAGGLSARSTKMTKDQAGFTESLLEVEIGSLFADALERETGWSRPVAVANDTVMALHYFLGPSRRAGHARVGLFINGTGSNFSAAEAYAVRPEGFISREGEDYIPERITRSRPLRAGERAQRFFVNYEAGSIDLVGTRTRFDVDREYPIERNALAGGNAFSQQLRAYVEEFVSPAAYATLCRNWDAIAGGGSRCVGPPDGRTVDILAGEKEDPRLLAGLEADAAARSSMAMIARCIVERSALHAALVLAAATLRTGFGLGENGLPDLLGLEGSVWKSPGYPALVRKAWQAIIGGKALRVDFAEEPSFNASLPGPLYLAAMDERA